METGPCYLIAISGVSSSGKTTLARLLRDIWPRTTIIHQDDFYWPDQQIPVNGKGLQDWDCIEAFDMQALRTHLEYVREHRGLRPDLISKEDQNETGESGVDQALVEMWKETAARMDREIADAWQIFIVDGILLLSEHIRNIHSLFDLKLFLRTDYETAKVRRESRAGYVTIDGFWEDPPGYVDDVVWPNYVREHSYLFKNDDVNGNEPDPVKCQEAAIVPVPSAARNDVNATLQWACNTLKGLIDMRSSKVTNL